ncbi:MAG: chorismate-binding protein [Proteobacteria bacterium]|nr:chorismate-binding protein [Pseudomonadota bacterium]
MKLSQLDRYPSFALLGPGFAESSWLLLAPLFPAPRARLRDDQAPMLVFAPFETSGSAAQRWVGDAARAVDLEWDVLARPLAVTLDEGDHEAGVERIRSAIAAGDVYQVCYCRSAALAPASGAELLATLCASGLPRFAAWVRLPSGEELVSASPELLFETRDRQVHAEPMKGTAGRAADAQLSRSEKDRAELAMITDLVRNDLIPLCRPRTVQVSCARRLVALPYALQAVSDIVGELAAGVGPLEVLAGLHPGGSVTGAPKRAALALIAELEAEPRGAYCGALGLARGDRSIFSLLIRTALRRGEGWRYGVGSGVVFASDAARERDELHLKLGALGCATRG